jgi:hypothetical protein
VTELTRRVMASRIGAKCQAEQGGSHADYSGIVPTIRAAAGINLRTACILICRIAAGQAKAVSVGRLQGLYGN